MLQIPVIALYRDSDRTVSAMISGNSKVEMYHYKNIVEATDIIKEAFKINYLDKYK
ncbi:hypothetical protein [Yersinia mollaretii]|uniref:hypothetical protein n=1 Tax=Yersinia mollaretii TaxID=33060 RepID=UPI000ADCBA51|nr:hypothetical protein [Yersinia mollaretii]MDA5527177.1 hypothetical protein [Yersinia mollaretii]MDR7874583.1 hypothetical protein [Yersinia mollaretii]WQC74180.1 hypothetical protein U1Z61_17405 [Yersinia mollaretii]